jgi:branched-chain amino acid aminotransferase
LPIVKTMGNFFSYNGNILKEGAAIIGADNRGLRYGDGLFETMKFKDGHLIFTDEHFNRLWNGMDILQFDIPKHFTREYLLQQISLLIKKNEIENVARIRLTVFRGDGGLYDAKDSSPNYIIQAWPLMGDAEKFNSNGLILGIYNEAKKSCDILSNLKHNNYLVSVMAALHAKKQKWNDAVILNTYNRICESTIANIFLISDNIIYTPLLSEGCVAGIMRKVLIDTISYLGFKLIEKQITIDELMEADEVFLTNSIYTIRWVHQVDNKKYANDITSKIYATLISKISN